jgi:hypothetical protein
MTPEDKKILDGLLNDCWRRGDDADDPESQAAYRAQAKALAQAIVDLSEAKCKTCHPELPLKLEFATDKVPWNRRGYPGTLATEIPEWGKEYANTSVHPDRLYTDAEMISNNMGNAGVEERAFAAMWDFECNCRNRGGILDRILGEEPILSLMRDQRDIWLAQLIAQALMQWLGTNCGLSFINESQRLAESDKKRLDRERQFLHKLTNCPAVNGRD